MKALLIGVFLSLCFQVQSHNLSGIPQFKFTSTTNSAVSTNLLTEGDPLSISLERNLPFYLNGFPLNFKSPFASRHINESFRSKNSNYFNSETNLNIAGSRDPLAYSIGAGGAMVFGAYILTYRYLKLKHKRDLVSCQKQEQLLLAQINLLQLNQENKTSQAVLIGQETERMRIARDLHDEMGGTLSLMKMVINSIPCDALNEKNKKSLARCKELASTSLDQLRSISHNLYPPVLCHFGLKDAIEQIVADVNNLEQTHFTLHIRGIDESLSKPLQLTIYRITLELVQNVLKHANAKEAEIRLLAHDDAITIMVEDNGKGINENMYQGLGLKSIHTRLEAFGGILQIDSSHFNGTTACINIPTLTL